MSWLAERFAQARAIASSPGRVIAVDFDDLLARLELTMAGIAAHFGLDVPASRLSELGRNPVMSRYSKAPEHAYSPALRAQLLAQARREHGDELRRGLVWLQAVASRHRRAGQLSGGL